MCTEKALRQTPIAKRSQPVAKAPQARFHNAPDKFTYALKDYTAERRATGWYISRTWAVSAAEKPQWVGPFATIETACLLSRAGLRSRSPIDTHCQ